MPLDDDQLLALPLLHDSGTSWASFLGDPALADRLRGPNLGRVGLCLDAAMAGQGIALASRFLVTRELSDGRLVQPTACSMRGPQTYYLLSRHRNPERPAVGALHQWILGQRET